MLLLAFFALGAITASFMGVVAGRLYTGQSIFKGRSRCDACSSELSPRALVPILSYVFARGRARCCSARIGPLSPLSEIALGTLFALSYLHHGIGIVLPWFLIALALLLGLVLYDLAHQILPAPLLILFVTASIVVSVLSSPSHGALIDTLLVALLVGGSLALIHVASRGKAMGFSDAPLSFGLALLTGAQAFSGFVFSFWIGAVCGIALLLGRPRGSRMGIEVPFAPYLALGFLLAYFTQWNPFAFAAALFP